MVKISVIVPVYNTARYLRKCLDSILSQTFKDFEIILVSDGPDEDTAICKEYAEKYSNISLITDVKKGLGGARNAGIEAAKGECLAFIDSDDFINSDFLEKMYNAMTVSDKVDCVQCGTEIVWQDDFPKKRKKDDENDFGITLEGEYELTNYYFGKVNVGTWNKLYKKELIQKYNLRFPENMKNEDAYFTWAYWSCCRNIYFISDKLYNYLRRDDSLMALTFNKGLGKDVLHHYVVGEMLYDFLNKNELYEKRKEAFLNSLIVCWYFVRDNASDKYKEIGHNKFNKFLQNISLPDEYQLLIEIKKKTYKKFYIKDGLVPYKTYKILGIKLLDIIKTDRVKKVRPFGLFSVYKEKYKQNCKEIYIFGIALLKKYKENNHDIYKFLGLKFKIKRKKSCKANFQSNYNIQGKNNKIIIVDENGIERLLKPTEKIDGLAINIIGSNNLVKIIQPSVFEKANFNLLYTNNSQIIINKTPRFMWSIKMSGGDNQYFSIDEGSDTSWLGQVHILDDKAGVEIGKDCMFAGEILIFASDAHAVYDINTKEVLNNVKSHVKIGNHCWIAQGVKFNKNAQIADNVVVGGSAVVTKRFECSNVVIAGNPAKIIKNNINWDRKSAKQMSELLNKDTRESVSV